MSHDSFQAPDLEQLASLLPAYDFESFIAQGGMGAVYKAKQRSLDRDVAIKVLPREFGADPEFRRSFETEAKAMAKLNHPNLIGVYDFGDIDGMPYIVMEYVEGKSLYHSSWNQRIDPATAAGIVKAICEGLAHAHDSGVVHRDIKPANIFLTPKAEPKIGDFGLAQAADSEGSGLAMGTPGYSAPEFLADHTTADHRADLYAVGVILHQLLTAIQPDGTNPPQQSCGDIRLDAIWRKAVEPDPNRRYQNAHEMARALDDWLRGPGAGGGRRLVTTPQATPQVARAQAAGARTTQRRPAAASTTLRTGPGAPAGPAGRPTKPQTTSLAPQKSSLPRNLVIIVALLVVIGVTYQILTEEKANREAHNEQVAENNNEDTDAGETAPAPAESDGETTRVVENDPGEPGATAPEETAPPVDPDETPLESLERLKPALLAGDRSEMPEGSQRRGDRDHFLVPTPMTWHRAAAFAEEHGAHLAVITAEEDLSWFAEFTPEDTTVWLGAGESDGESWLFVDGSTWPLERTPSGVGTFAALDSLGLVRARPAGTEFPFLITWRRDGSNPATLAEMLRRTRETLDSPSPAYPPGTDSYNGRRFAAITREVDHQHARQLAEEAGGTLAVPAESRQSVWLADHCEPFHAPEGLWLGGRRRDGIWTWCTGEIWQFADWAGDAGDAAADGAGLVLIPGEGWRPADRNETASGFIIEWSDDAASADEQAGGTIGELRAKATELLREARRDHVKDLHDNARAFEWDIDVWFRDLNSTESAKWSRHVDALKDQVKSNRVPDPGSLENIQLSARMAEVCETCRAKQARIESDYQALVTRIRDSYVKRLETAAEAPGSGARGELVANIRRAIDHASDLDTWIEDLLDDEEDE